MVLRDLEQLARPDSAAGAEKTGATPARDTRVVTPATRARGASPRPAARAATVRNARKAPPLILASIVAGFWAGGTAAYLHGYFSAQGTALGSAGLATLGAAAALVLLPALLLISAVFVVPRLRVSLWHAISAVQAKTSTWLARLRPSVPEVEGAFSYEVGESPPEFLNPRHLIKAGAVVTLIFIVGFMGWAAVAPLDSASIAPGVVIVESRRKAVQHLEGGIIREIMVAEGDQVSAGQVLFELDDTQARATLGVLQGEVDALAAQEARLIAERDGQATITFPPELFARLNDPKVAEAIQGEEGAFRTRRETLDKEIAILNGRIQENTKIIDGLRAQQVALETQLALIKKESVMIEALVTKGIEAMPRLLALQRTDANLSGQRGQVTERMAQVQVNTGETELQIVNLRNQFLADVLKDLRDVQTRRFNLEDRIQGARDVLNRQDIVAPVEGQVVGLNVHTRGAVIRPGETLMEIVPQQDELDIEAHLRPEDIDDVQVGAAAKVTLTGYAQRRLPVATGIITSVSGDRFVDQRTGQAYFNAQVSVDSDAWSDYPDVKLVPGMPVEVAVETGSRTALEYLFLPIQAVMRRGMREK